MPVRCAHNEQLYKWLFVSYRPNNKICVSRNYFHTELLLSHRQNSYAPTDGGAPAAVKRRAVELVTKIKILPVYCDVFGYLRRRSDWYFVYYSLNHT
jgi:hypothetical protein